MYFNFDNIVLFAENDNKDIVYYLMILMKRLEEV